MILVDAAIWPWRGHRWAHLVSDTALDELHEFAAGLGVRRAAFQGDHYDIDERRRARAVARGAHPVEGRELVRRLGAAGLRDRRTVPPWDVVDQFQLQSLDDIDARLRAHMDAPSVATLVADVDHASRQAQTTRAFEGRLLRRGTEQLVSLAGPAESRQLVDIKVPGVVHISWDDPIRTVEILRRSVTGCDRSRTCHTPAARSGREPPQCRPHRT